jgi:hypothetical protein
VLIPGAAPEIAETLRMVLGWAWTYVIVAELIGASSGIGHMITDSQALLATDQIIFGIIVIGLIGLASDLLFKWANRGCFRGRSWGAEHARPASSSIRARRRAPLPRRATRRAPTLALQATDLDVADNDFITILGPSGCGKSTLLRIVAGLDHADGRARCCSTAARITGPAPTAAWCSRATRCSPGSRCCDNVCFGLRERGLPRAQQLEIAHGFSPRSA